MAVPKRSRFILFFLGLLLLAAVFWPVYVGLQMEKAFSQPQRLETYDALLEYVPAAYSRSAYHAVATGEMHLVMDDVALVWPVQHHIKHRVLGAEVQTVSDAMRPLQASHEAFRRFLDEGRPRLTTFLRIGGDVTLRLQVQPVQDLDLPWPLPLFQKAALDAPSWNTGLMRGGLARKNEIWLLHLETDFLRLQDASTELTLHRPHLRLALQTGETEGEKNPLPDFDFSLEMDVIQVEDAQGIRLRGEAVGVTASQNAGLQRLDGVVKWHAGRITLDRLQLSPVELSLRVFRLDHQAMSELLFLSGWISMDFPALRDPPRMDLLHILNDLLGAHPGLQWGLQINTSANRQLRWDLTLDVREKTAQQAGGSLLDALELEMTLLLGQQWLEMAAAREEMPWDLVHAWIERSLVEHWLVEADTGQWSSRVLLEGGRFQVNGRDETLRLLLQLLSMAKDH